MSDEPGRVKAAAEREVKAGETQTRSVGKGPLMLAKLIVSYLNKKEQGYSSDYAELVKKLNSKGMEPQEMTKWLRALKLCVAHFTQDCDMLVGATLRLPWFTQSPPLIDLYLDYLANLVSAQVCYVDYILSILTKALFSPTTQAGGEAAYHNIHKALQTVFSIIPRAPSKLVLALNKHYPYRTRGADVQEVAVRNCLHVCSYCPTITEDILCLLLSKMVIIDAEIKQDEDGMMEVVSEEEEEEEEEGMQFHVDMDQELLTPSEKTMNGFHSDELATPHTSSPPRLGPCLCLHQVMRNSMTENMDIHMTVLQQYILSRCYQDGKLLITEEAVVLLQSLLKIFSDLILPTHAISHVQFLIYHVTSFHKEFPGYFLDFLWRKFEDFNSPAVLRQTAAAYIASYVARAKFVTLETAKLCLIHMMQWLHQYLDMCDPSNLGPFIVQHGPFYSLCQAVFYIFVFRHHSLVDMDNGLQFLRNLNFERIVSSKLNPLRVCLPYVVEMFSKIASRHEVVFCYTILEENKRLLLSLQASLGGQADTPTNNHLDCFFPFDPYALKRSSRCIHPLYQQWEEEEEEEEEVEEEGEEREGQTEDKKTGDEVDSVLSSSHNGSGLGVSYASPDVDTFLPSHTN